MAYAAVLSLMKILERILHADRYWVLHDKQQIESLQEKVSFLQDFLEDSSILTSKGVKILEIKIRDVAYKAEDFIESYVSTQFLSKGNGKKKKMIYLAFCRDLEKVIEETRSIQGQVMKIKPILLDLKFVQRRNFLPVDGSRNEFSGRNTMVGFDEELTKIKDLLTSSSSKLEIISIVGMGGIGKTTLARNVFADSLIVYQFDTRAWITISQHYHVQEILTGLLDSTGHVNHELHRENIEELAECLYKSLKGKRYLIVMDDVWDTKAWEDVKRLFPNDNNGSRIILTTRLTNVTASFSHVHHLSFLSLDESWNLLCERVFGGECYPTYLKEIGWEIARNCRGLPLSIVVVGGLLSKDTTLSYWKNIASTISSLVTTSDGQCSKILSLSYNHLPCYLKPCFLYLGVFQEDDDIRVSKLIKLWVAEGFLKPEKSKSMEDIAVEYLEDLEKRSLVLVHELGSDGKVKKYRIHDLLRDLCIREAQNETFFHVPNLNFDTDSEGINSLRRVTIHTNSPSDFRYEYVNYIYQSDVSTSLTRSFLHFEHLDFDFDFASIVELGGFRLLRVLDVAGINISGFPDEVVCLVHLSYLSVSVSNDRPWDEGVVPASISRLWSLQTLILLSTFRFYKFVFFLPVEIWKMPQLRHVQLSECYLPDPPSSMTDVNGFIVLSNLQTVSLVKNCRFTNGIVSRIPKLKKLGIIYEVKFAEDWSGYCLGNLVHLHELETLKFICPWETTFPPSPNFPLSLKKLTLEGCNLPWEDLTIVGSLPNLQVLKLLNHACAGDVWEPVEGEFCQLKFLKLEYLGLVHWRANSSHFPRLKRLHLSFCYLLMEIPNEIGDIQTLELIQLDFCTSSVVSSAQRMQEEQQDMGNDNLQVCTGKLIPITGKFTS